MKELADILWPVAIICLSLAVVSLTVPSIVIWTVRPWFRRRFAAPDERQLSVKIGPIEITDQPESHDHAPPVTHD